MADFQFNKTSCLNTVRKGTTEGDTRYHALASVGVCMGTLNYFLETFVLKNGMDVCPSLRSYKQYKIAGREGESSMVLSSSFAGNPLMYLLWIVNHARCFSVL